MIYDLFPTSVYVKMPKTKEESKVIKSIQKEISSKIDKIKLSGVGKPDDWDMDVRTNIHLQKNMIYGYGLDNLQKYIEKHLLEYLNHFNFSEQISCYLRESWINFTSNGEGQEVHAHGGNLVSGVYFYKTPNGGGDIVFENPNPYIRAEMFPYGTVPSTFPTTYFTPSEGMLILFPSWLFHKVRRSNSEVDRVSIAFNYFKHTN